MQVRPIVRFVISSITLCLLLQADEKAGFHVGPVESYAHQKAGDITVGAKPFDKPQMIDEAFGKVDLLKYGVVPVLVVVENKGKNAIDMQTIEVNLVATDGRKAPAVSPDELFNLKRSKPKRTINPMPKIPMPAKKNPLTKPELVTRAFGAQIVPPGETASGFFYFEAKSEPGDTLYLSGMRDARTQREILYFEFPLSGGN